MKITDLKNYTVVGSETSPSVGLTVPEGPSLSTRLKSAVDKRADALLPAIDSNQNIGSKILQTAGSGAGLAQDIISEVGKSAYDTFVPDVAKNAIKSTGVSILNTDIGKAGIEAIGKGMEAYQSWAKEHPEASGNLESVLNISALLPIGKAVEVGGKAAIDTAETGINAAKNIVSKGKELISGTKESNFVRDLVTPELNKKNSISAIKTGKVVESTGLTGERDVSKAIANLKDIEDQVSKVPGISPKNTNLQNINAIHDEIGNIANNLEGQISAVEKQIGKDRGYFSPNEFKSYFKNVTQDIADNPLIVGDAEKTASKILNKFNSLVEENGYTPSGLLKSRKDLDQWMLGQKGNKVFDPATENALSIALRGIRQGGNDFLASKVPDVAVKDLLRQQSLLYDAIDNIAPKAATEGTSLFKRFIKNNPKTIKALKYGATAVGGGVVANEVLK